MVCIKRLKSATRLQVGRKMQCIVPARLEISAADLEHSFRAIDVDSSNSLDVTEMRDLLNVVHADSHLKVTEEHARRVVSTLGSGDLETLADEQPVTDVRCHFCGHNYPLEADVLRKIADELRAKTS